MLRTLTFAVACLLSGGCNQISETSFQELHNAESAAKSQPPAVENTGGPEILNQAVLQGQNILEQAPAEFSVAYFANMSLEGKNFKLLEVLEDNSVYTRHAIEYSSNGLKISGIMNIPKGEGPFPLIILNHGYINPAVYTRGRGLKREQDYLARQGFAVLHTDYRGHAFSDKSPDERNIYDAGLEYAMDSVNAILAVKEANILSINSDHVGMMGHSLGGGVTFNVAVARPDLIDAVVLYAPVHSDAWQNFTRWRTGRDEGDKTLEALGTRRDNPELWDALSSLTYLNNIDDPVLVFHGTADESVPKEWSDFLVNRLKKLKKNVKYVEYENEKHEFIPKFDDFMKQTAAFFKDNLSEDSKWKMPIDKASERITKKPFGIFITPENSPVRPERFSGYHTGTDFELFDGEEASAINIKAICSGELIFKGRVNGYGGVIVQLCNYKGDEVTVLYGHLNIDSVTNPAGKKLQSGDYLGNPGEGYSNQTDGERPHLHLAVHKGKNIEFKGYVQNESELSKWIDPEAILMF